jgi:predicted nucleic acid-binding protein
LSAYADTSFLVSLYSPDSNSTEAAGRMQQAPLPLLLTPLGELELVNALQLRLFRKEVHSAEVRAAYKLFRADMRDGILSMKSLPAAIYTQAKLLALRWTAKIGVRTLDIIHVAAALALEVETFNTFDDRQRKLARAAGLTAP